MSQPTVHSALGTEHTIEIEVDGERLEAMRIGHHANAAALVLHGAGEDTDKGRSAVLARALARRGLDVVALDFAGHGQSTGALEDLTLSRRAKQATAALRLLAGKPAVVCGFSMSGQTACDLLAVPDHGIRALALFAPAIYAAEARDVPFGQSKFTQIIRRTGSWKTSCAITRLRAFDGPILLFTPPKDEVIPAEVLEAVEKASPLVRRIVLEGSSHQLGRWLTEHPDQAETVAASIVDTFQAVLPT